MTRAEMNAIFGKMTPGEQDIFIMRLEALAKKLAVQHAQERQAHCDSVAAELLAEVQL